MTQQLSPLRPCRRRRRPEERQRSSWPEEDSASQPALQPASQPVQQPAALQQVQVEAVPAGGVRIGAAAPPPEDLVDSGMDEMD